MQAARSRLPPIDNPTSEPGLTVGNGVVWTAQTRNRRGDLYGHVSKEVTGEVLAHEPLWTIPGTASGCGENATATAIKVFSCLNGLGESGQSFDTIRKQLRFVGFARTEDPARGIPGTQNSDIAIAYRGIMTIMHTGHGNIPAGSLVTMSLPNPKITKTQAWNDRESGKVLGETNAYTPELAHTSRLRGFALLTAYINNKNDEQLRAEIDADYEYSGYVNWWKSMITFAYISAVECKRAEDTLGKSETEVAEETRLLASRYGVIEAKSSEQKEVKAFQMRLLKRLFVMKHKDNEVLYDPKALYFELRQATRNNSENHQLQEATRKQAGCVETMFNAITFVGHEKRSQVFGVALTGGLPESPMDVLVTGPC